MDRMALGMALKRKPMAGQGDQIGDAVSGLVGSAYNLAGGIKNMSESGDQQQPQKTFYMDEGTNLALDSINSGGTVMTKNGSPLTPTSYELGSPSFNRGGRLCKLARRFDIGGPYSQAGSAIDTAATMQTKLIGNTYGSKKDPWTDAVRTTAYGDNTDNPLFAKSTRKAAGALSDDLANKSLFHAQSNSTAGLMNDISDKAKFSNTVADPSFGRKVAGVHNASVRGAGWGAKVGASVGGGYGMAIGAIAGGLAGLGRGIGNAINGKKRLRELNKAIEARNNYNAASVNTAINNLGKKQNNTAMTNYAYSRGGRMFGYGGGADVSNPESKSDALTVDPKTVELKGNYRNRFTRRDDLDETGMKWTVDDYTADELSKMNHADFAKARTEYAYRNAKGRTSGARVPLKGSNCKATVADSYNSNDMMRAQAKYNNDYKAGNKFKYDNEKSLYRPHYGVNNKDFRDNYKDQGFERIGANDMKQGDIAMFETDASTSGYHAGIFDHKDGKGHDRTHYDSGDKEETMRHGKDGNGGYYGSDAVEGYRYVGTKDERNIWNNAILDAGRRFGIQQAAKARAMSKDYLSKALTPKAKATDDIRLHSKGGKVTLARMFAEGGKISNSKNQFKTGVTEFNTGGTHEENPNGGIPQGVAPDGLPNLVEQGEVKLSSITGKDNNYILSNRLVIEEDVADEFGIDRKYVGETFASAFKKAYKPFKERPNDPISRREVASLSNMFQGAQEAIKARDEAAEAEDAMRNPSDEALADMGEQARQMGQDAAQSMMSKMQGGQEANQQEQIPQETMQQEQAPMQQDVTAPQMGAAPMQQEQPTGQETLASQFAAMGGPLRSRRFAKGGHFFSKKGEMETIQPMKPIEEWTPGNGYSYDDPSNADTEEERRLYQRARDYNKQVNDAMKVVSDRARDFNLVEHLRNSRFRYAPVASGLYGLVDKDRYVNPDKYTAYDYEAMRRLHDDPKLVNIYQRSKLINPDAMAATIRSVGATQMANAARMTGGNPSLAAAATLAAGNSSAARMGEAFLSARQFNNTARQADNTFNLGVQQSNANAVNTVNTQNDQLRTARFHNIGETVGNADDANRQTRMAAIDNAANNMGAFGNDEANRTDVANMAVHKIIGQGFNPAEKASNDVKDWKDARKKNIAYNYGK